MEKKELESCPFCGEDCQGFVGWDGDKDVFDEEDLLDEDLIESWAICCKVHQGGCGACSGYADTKEEAVDKWNMRANNIAGVSE